MTTEYWKKRLKELISTHTPARGVTLPDVTPRNIRKHFYSHAREGRDEVIKGAITAAIDFYSHAREGRDHTGKKSWDR